MSGAAHRVPRAPRSSTRRSGPGSAVGPGEHGVPGPLPDLTLEGPAASPSGTGAPQRERAERTSSSSGRRRRAPLPSPHGWRRPVVRYVAVSLAVLLVVGVLTDVVLSSLARQRALDAAVGRTDRLVETVVLPLLGDGAASTGATGTGATVGAAQREALDAVVDGRVADGSIRSMTVWSHDGDMLYARGRGSRDDLVSDDPDALAGGPVLRVEDASDAAVDVEGVSALPGRGFARLAASDHVHVVVLGGEDRSDRPLLVEVVVPGAEVLRVAESLRVPMVVAALVALLVLALAQLPLAVSLARRVYSAERSWRVLLTQAVASADLERRRLAQQLHDDVIQDLAGLGYGLESLQRHGPADQQEALVAARRLVQDDVAKLRGILTDLYPAAMDSDRLLEGLEVLAAPLRDSGVDVVVHVGGLERLDRSRATLLHRVARECLVNVAKHAAATTVVVTVRDDGDGDGTLLQVRDDGRGFDPVLDAREEGHLGLTIVRDLVVEIGGSLQVGSRPGDGTTVTLRLPPA